MGACVPKTEKSCRNSKAIVTKTIRIPLRNIVELLPEDPNIKIISYVRDPRGIIASRASINENLGIINDSIELCEHMKDDLAIEETLASAFPNRTIRVRYEDLALDPIIKTGGAI